MPQNWRIVLTGRPGWWNDEFAINASNLGGDHSRCVASLKPLRYPDDIEPFVATWFRGRPEHAAGLVAQLHDRPALRQVATVPLMLAFYCMVGDKQMPSRRHELYVRMIRRLLVGGWRRDGGLDHDPDSCLPVLRAWAWSAASNDYVSGWDDSKHIGSRGASI